MKRPDGSWEQFDDYVLDYAVSLAAEGKRYALVTLVKIEGSSQRPLGAQMVISEAGEWVGYLSGGCIERAIASEALDALHCGENRQVRYGKGSKYFDIQLPCGSAIELYFDVSQSDLSLINSNVESRRAVSMRMTGEALKDPFHPTYLPRRRLIIVGIGPALVHLSRLAASASILVDVHSPDEDTRKHAMSHGARVFALSKHGEGFEFNSDQRSALVLMFHDHDWEASILPSVLADESLFYIGALGSRRTHKRRVDDLRRSGIPEQLIAKIHGPAGLFAGAKRADDIALSILAEVIVADNRRSIPQLEERPIPQSVGDGSAFAETFRSIQ